MIRGILLLIRRSLRQHFLSTTITVLSVAMACGLTMAIFGIERQAREAFIGGRIGWDAVLGARGSQLQLVLNAVYFLEASPGNIPWSMYQHLKHNTPGVRLAVPYAMGDNYLGYRIVGTTSEMFDEYRDRDGIPYQTTEGRFFDPGYMEAVVGSFAAARTGLRIGDEFQPYHGLDFDPNAAHAERYTVVGILEPTNTPADRVLWIPIEGVFRMEGHVLRGTGEEYTPEAGVEIPDEHKEVSAVMLQLTSPTVGWNLNQTVNRQGTVATFAHPIGAVMADLFEKLGFASQILRVVAYLVMAVSIAAILASIYNTMNERRREIAILRALGARRLTICAAVIGEAAAIGVMGALLAVPVYTAIVTAAASVAREQTGVVLEAARMHPALVAVPVGAVALAALSGVVPAIRAYRVDVAENLTPHS